MSTSEKKAKDLISNIQIKQSIAEIGKSIFPRTKDQIKNIPSIPTKKMYSEAGKTERLNFLKEQCENNLDYISGKKSFEKHEDLKGNIENFIGMAQVPIGIAGPMLINGTQANGDFFVPLATTEGALVASYNRGMKICRESGGVSAVCLTEGIQRSPYFKMKNIVEVGIFVEWVLHQTEAFNKIVSETSRYAKLDTFRPNMEGNSVIFSFEYTTGDAAGQNMVTICTNEICKYIIEHSPVKPTEWYIESNYSGDKKATALSFTNVRGKKAVAEIVIPKEILEKSLKTTAIRMADYWRTSAIALVQSGSIGIHGHISNGLAALFIATGQDAACISESAIGVLRMEVVNEEDLYVSLSLPGLIVGTVGGGTGLPTQRECLELMDCYGPGKARKFAEICVSLALAGEISIAAAITEGYFAEAHQTFGRK